MTMLMSLLLLGQAKPVTTPASVATHVQFLKKLKPGMTQAQILPLLPKGLSISPPTFVAPVDGHLVGNVMHFRGSFSGSISFLRQKQIDILRGVEDILPRDYRASDPVHSVQLIIRTWPKYSKSTSSKLLAEVTKSVGKPEAAPVFYDEWANDFGGWFANYKLNGKPLSFYEYQGDRYEARIELLIGNPIFVD